MGQHFSKELILKEQMSSMLEVKFDTKEAMKGLDKLGVIGDLIKVSALNEMADTLLLLSRFEVPLDKGQLQNSGSKSIGDDDIEVGYNKVYALYQDEGGDSKRKITNYQNGRKSQYLKEPFEKNIGKWHAIYVKESKKQL